MQTYEKNKKIIEKSTEKNKQVFSRLSLEFGTRMSTSRVGLVLFMSEFLIDFSRLDSLSEQFRVLVQVNIFLEYCQPYAWIFKLSCTSKLFTTKFL